MTGSERRVLVVEDDPVLGKMLTLILQADAHRVITVSSGEEALERMRVGQFDVVLSDLRIGLGISGLQLCTLVRRDWPGVRFVLTTGAMAIDADEAKARGVDELLIKPFLPAEMRRSVSV